MMFRLALLPFLFGGISLARADPIRGVNLGGWLLAEQWIIPSLFSSTGIDAVVDEWTFGQYAPNAQELLTKHWDTFITESDFEEMSQAGINFVRPNSIPIGYWAYGVNSSEPYVHANQTAYLDRALGWAKQYNISAMVDLHGVPGSQNGNQNSGHQGAVEWQASSLNAKRATSIIGTMNTELQGKADYLELINEPVLDRTWIANIETYTKSYYNSAYPAVTSGLTGVIHDGFRPLSEWEGFLPGAMLDTHVYSGLFTYYGMNPNTTPPAYQNITDNALRKICQLKETLATSNKNRPTFVGEFSLAQPQRPAGSKRAHNAASGKLGRRQTQQQIEHRRQLFDTQRAVFEENTAGWAMWTWKMGYDSPWSYRSGLKGGWITSDLSQRGSAAVC